MSGQLAHWCHICGLFGVGEEGEVLGDLPYEDLAIIGAGRNDAVVEGVPVGVQHYSCMPAEQRYNVGYLSPLVQRDDRECATATRFPVDREVFRVDLEKIRIPSVPTDMKVVVAEFLPGRLAEDVSCSSSKGASKRQP